MNTKLLEFVTPPPALYYGFYTQKTSWEEKFTLVNMKLYGRRNVRKHREIKNDDKYIALEISLELDCLDKIEVTSPESSDYLGRSGKGLNTTLTLRNKIKNKKGLTLMKLLTNI